MTETPRTDEVFNQFGPLADATAMAYFSLCVELERENAALREDKARIDWLERSGPRVYYETEESVCCMKITVCLPIGATIEPQSSVREAIDAARRASP